MPDDFGDISPTKAIFKKYLNENYSQELKIYNSAQNILQIYASAQSYFLTGPDDSGKDDMNGLTDPDDAWISHLCMSTENSSYCVSSDGAVFSQKRDMSISCGNVNFPSSL